MATQYYDTIDSVPQCSIYFYLKKNKKNNGLTKNNLKSLRKQRVLVAVTYLANAIFLWVFHARVQLAQRHACKYL